MFSPNLSIKTCVHFMRGTEGNYVIFVFISFKREGNEYNVSPVYIKTKHSVAAAAASKENRGMTQLTLYLSCVLMITGHYTCGRQQMKYQNIFNGAYKVNNIFIVTWYSVTRFKELLPFYNVNEKLYSLLRTSILKI